jgi:cell division septation protein DedD
VAKEPAIELASSTQNPNLSETENTQAENLILDETSIETDETDITHSGASDSSEDNAIAENVAPEPVPETTITPHKRMYHLIAGSFQNPENADQLTQSYRSHGYEPTLIGPAENGYYRLSVAAILRKSDALVELKKVRETYNPNVWLLRQ